MKRRSLLVIVLILIAASIWYLEMDGEKTTVIPPVESESPQEIPSIPQPPTPSAPSDQAPSPIPTDVKNGQEVETRPSLKDGKYPLAPDLVGIVGYLNGAEDGLSLSQFNGNVVLIDFWTYTCINCIRTLPYLKSWDVKYKDKGLVIIGVHSPEFGFEKQRENVQQAIDKHDLGYRVVQDNDFKTWRAYSNRYWPAKYLIDKDGYIRYSHFGEGAYETTEKNIQELLAEGGESIDESITSESVKSRLPLTPELYAGYHFALPRSQNIGNGGFQPDEVKNYTLPSSFQRDRIYLNGSWRSNEDNLTAESSGAIVLRFLAEEVNIVGSGNSEVEVYIDGSYISRELAGSDVQFDGLRAYIDTSQPRLYNVIKGEYGKYELMLIVKKDFWFSAFTFG